MRYKLHIPCASRIDLLEKSIESLTPAFAPINVWWGGGIAPSGLPDICARYGAILHDPGLVSCVSLYNMCIRNSWDDDVMFMAHNDIEMHPDVAHRFLASARSIFEAGGKWGAVFQHYDVLACFNMAAVHDVGPWDTMYFQYHADVDYYHTLRKAGWKETYVGKPDEIHHHGSSSVKSDSLFHWRTRIRDSDGFDLRYYRAKWGGFVNSEQFPRPFADFDPTLDYEAWKRRNYRGLIRRRVGPVKA